jgi:drug/metabolite transporter (DMT)-like permease
MRPWRVLTYLFALLAAMANATSSTLQRKANLAEPDSAAFTPGIILDLLRRPVWLGGILAVIAGFLLQALALAHGNLAAVEPILTLELPLTLAFASFLFHRRLHRREWTAAALLTVGVALLLGSLQPHGGGRRVSDGDWAIGTVATLAVVAGLVVWARRRGKGERAALLGIATGTGFGLTAALMSRMSEAFARGGVVAAAETWQTWAMVLTGLGALYLLQNALQAGSLVAVQPGLTLSDPLVSIIWGVFLLRERVQGGTWIIGDVIGAALIALGTLRLSHSPLLHSDPGPSEPGTAPADHRS